MSSLKISLYLSFLFMGLSGCSNPEPSSKANYQAVDLLIDKIVTNISDVSTIEKTLDIDHSRLGLDSGSVMPPARVIIFSEPKFNTELIKIKPLIALDLPFRILAFHDTDSGKAHIIYNSFDYLVSRYQLKELPTLERNYNATINLAINDISESSTTKFSNDIMVPDGIKTIISPYDFATTKKKVLAAIASQDDAISFGEVDFQADALALGEVILPNTLILFGGPAPGATAMREAQTLGLDAFCQKFLLWQDESGQTYLSYNDLLYLAERQNVNKSLALRVINYRLNDVFEGALK